MVAPKEREARIDRMSREALAMIEAERVARQKKTAKLRALRLAREAAERAGPTVNPAEEKPVIALKATRAGKTGSKR